MRIVHICSAVFLVMLFTPGALACQFEPGAQPSQPKVFWPEAPSASQLAPSEIAIEVSFSHFARPYDPRRTDVVIIEGCGPSVRIYTIERVLAGEDPGAAGLLVSNRYAFETGGNSAILVGRILPLEARNTDALSRPDVDPTLRLFEPRLPPQ